MKSLFFIHSLKSIVFFLFYQFALLAQTPFPESPRGLLMGNAYSSLATDEYTLSYNPALLARHSGFSFYPINPQFRVTNPLTQMSRLQNLGGSSSELTGALMNNPINIGLNANPALKMAKFGLTVLANSNSQINVLNKVSPALRINHTYDRGFALGFAMPLSGSFKDGQGTQVAMGFSLKYIQRESIDGTYQIVSPTIFTYLNGSDFNQIIQQLGLERGQGWGLDWGVDYVTGSGPHQIAFSAAIRDIGTNNLLTAENNKVTPIFINSVIGGSYKFSLGGILEFTGALDLTDVHEQGQTFNQMLRMGAELAFGPVFSIMAGRNVERYSYGLSTNLGFLKLTTGLFGTDEGPMPNQIVTDQFFIYLSLLDFKFPL